MFFEINTWKFQQLLLKYLENTVGTKLKKKLKLYKK